MAQKTIMLPGPQKNDFLFWTVATQCQFLGTVVIRDNSTIYTSISKTNPETHIQVLDQAARLYTGTEGLRVEIDIPKSSNIIVANEQGQPIEAEGKTIGYFYNICIEDYIDADYNDFYINVVAWNKKG